jgi:uncharacterized protein (TIGR02588 family)
MSQFEAPQNQDRQAQKPPRSIAEWVTFSIASLILAGIVGLVCSLWVGKRHHQPPELSVTRSAETRQAAGQFYIPFQVINSGGGTAESVQVIAELTIDGEVAESGEQQVDFLSGGETQDGAFIFTRDPQQGELIIRVASYKLP